MKEIGIILLAIFILTYIWKWRESKWILNHSKLIQTLQELMRTITSPDKVMAYKNEIVKANMRRDKLHQLGFAYIALSFTFINYLMFGLTLKAFIMTLICGVMFWIMDIFLNIFIKVKPFYRGKTAKLDKIPFWVRAVLLALLLFALSFKGIGQTGIGENKPLHIEIDGMSCYVTTKAYRPIEKLTIVVCDTCPRNMHFTSQYHVYIDFNFKWIKDTFTPTEIDILMTNWNFILTGESMHEIAQSFTNINIMIRRGIKRTIDIGQVKKCKITWVGVGVE